MNFSNILFFSFLFAFSYFTPSYIHAQVFNGTWYGTVVQEAPKEDFTIVLRIREDRRGRDVGTWTLSNGCGGSIKLVDRLNNDMTLRAYINSEIKEESYCPQKGEFRLRLLDEKRMAINMNFKQFIEASMVGTVRRMGDFLDGAPMSNLGVERPTIKAVAFDRENSNIKLSNITLCNNANAQGNCLDNQTTFTKNTNIIYVNYNIFGAEEGEKMLAYWYHIGDMGKKNLIDYQSLSVNPATLDKEGRFMFILPFDWITGDYRLEIRTGNGEVAVQEFNMVRE